MRFLLLLHCSQACAGGYVLDVQLPLGHPCVAVLSLLRLMHDLKEQSSAVLTPAHNGAAKVLLRFPVQVRVSCSC